MLTFLNPEFAVAGLIAAIAMAALHFIVRRRPPSMLFATARFVPEGRVVTTRWAKRPSDALLAALRAAAVLLAGLALAGPVLRPQRVAMSSVILADRSRAVANAGEVDDSVAAVFRQGDVIVSFDSTRRLAIAPAGDSALPSGRARGSLSAALVAAVRAASQLRDRADSVALVIVSPMAAEEIDNATVRIRAEWPGRARVVPVAARPQPPMPAPVTLLGESADPLRVALPPATRSGSVGVRVVRSELTAEDSAWVSADARVVVHWPVTAKPAGFAARPLADTVAGVIARTSYVIAPLARPWRFASTVPLTVAASWLDGEPAAVEWSHGAGCIRSVAIPVAGTGDLVLRDEFRAVVSNLLAPCGGAFGFTRAPAATVARLAGGGPLASAQSFAPPVAARNSARPWLLLAALSCVLGEMFVRRRKRTAEPGAGADTFSGEPEAKVA